MYTLSHMDMDDTSNATDYIGVYRICSTATAEQLSRAFVSNDH